MRTQMSLLTPGDLEFLVIFMQRVDFQLVMMFSKFQLFRPNQIVMTIALIHEQ